MKLKINKDSLNKVLSFLNTGVPAKPIIPIEGMVLFSFKADEDRCTIRISNSMVEMSAYLKVECEEDIEFCLPAFMISRTVATFPDGEIQIIPKYNKETNDLSAIALKPEGQRKNYKIACYPIGDFASWDIKEDPHFTVKISMKELNEKLRIIGSNVDTRDIRAQFSNIQMVRQDGKMSFVSGNAIMIGQLVTDAEIPEGRIVPKELAKYVSLLTDESECELSFSNSYINLSYGSINIVCRLIDGDTVNYQRVFKAEPDKNFEAVREDVLGALIRLGTYSDEEGRINIKTDGELMTLFVSHGGNEGEEVIDILNPDNITLDVNLNFAVMRAAVQNCKAEKLSISQVRDQDFKNVFIRPLGSKNELWMFAPFAK